MLYSIQGKTLIQRTIENAKSFSFLDQPYIATDSLEIARHVEDLAPIIITSSKPPSGTDRIAEALSSSIHLQGASFVINLQGDHPFVSSETVKSALDLLIEDPLADISTAVFPCSLEQAKNPHIVKCVFDKNQTALYFSRSPIPYKAEEYFQHIGIYIYRASFLRKFSQMKRTHLEKAEDLEQLRFLENGYKIKVAISKNAYDGVGVDVPPDVLRCQNILHQSLI